MISSSRDFWIYWKSDISPPAPMTVYLPTGCSRWISLKRAREPYEAGEVYQTKSECVQDVRDRSPSVSAAIMMPSLYLNARTLVPVTIGCLRETYQLIFNLEKHIFTH